MSKSFNQARTQSGFSLNEWLGGAPPTDLAAFGSIQTGMCLKYAVSAMAKETGHVGTV